jgi:hypothetical protein
MKKETKINFVAIVGCIILAAILPSVVVAGFGILGGVYLCGYTILMIIAILKPRNRNKEQK